MNKPVPSRKSRDATAATKPSRLVGSGFRRGRALWGGLLFAPTRSKLTHCREIILLDPANP